MRCSLPSPTSITCRILPTGSTSSSVARSFLPAGRKRPPRTRSWRALSAERRLPPAAAGPVEQGLLRGVDVGYISQHMMSRALPAGGGITMISQRQIDFRQEYRSRIMGWYDGYFHIAIIYAMGAAAFYIYIEHIHDVTALEWLTVPITFLFTNLFEWAVHKY